MNYVREIEKILARAEEAGFQRGWQAARDALSSPASLLKVAGSAMPPVTKKKRKKSKSPAPSGGMTVEQRVLDCIEENEGITGANIIKMLGNVNPATVRTMLRRLRLNEKIEKAGEGWVKK